MRDEPKPDSVGDRLIAALEAEAKLVDEGRFSVDLGRAGAKLGQFALADPDAWTLLLVEVASLLDATRIDFRYERDRLTVSIEPSSLARSDLDGLSAWALADESEHDNQRVRKQLALAYLALRARAVAQVAIVCVPPDEAAFALDYVLGKERFGEFETRFDPGLHFIVVFGQVDAPDRSERERALLEARCNCSRVPVHIDSFLIAKGWSRIFGSRFVATPEQLAAHFEVPVTLDGQTIGTAGFHHTKTDPAFTRVLVNGVMVEYVQLDAQPGFRALVEADLRRDLSQGKVVRDERFDKIAAAVAQAYLIAAERRLGGVMVTPEVASPPEPGTKAPIRRVLLALAAIGVGAFTAATSTSVLDGVVATAFILFVFYLSERPPDQ